jgi:MFS family permease
MLLAFALAALVFAGVVAPWHILVLAFLSGVVQAFDGTARQTFVKDMVGKEDLANAVALNSTTWNLSRIVGPALAGFTLAYAGAAWCFFLNGVSFLAVIAGLLMMSLTAATPVVRKASMWADIKEGLNFIRGNPTVLTLIALVAVAGMFGAYDVMLPAYALDVMHVNAEGLGWLSTAAGVGALAGALVVAAFATSTRKGQLLTIANLAMPLTLLLMAISSVFPLSLLVMAGVGLTTLVQNALANSLVQLSVPDHLRGRVMSVYMLCFFGMSPLGGLQAGFIAEHFGVPAGIAVGAVVALVFALILLARVPVLRSAK